MRARHRGTELDRLPEEVATGLTRKQELAKQVMALLAEGQLDPGHREGGPVRAPSEGRRETEAV